MRNALFTRKSQQPVGRHLAARKPAAPLTEIANAVVNSQLQRRAAVVATAGGILMSSFAATHLDRTPEEALAAAYEEFLRGTEVSGETEAEFDTAEFFAALPGWVVEGVAHETPEGVLEDGLAVVAATPAPPPPPPARSARRAPALNPPPASVAGNAVLEIAARYVGSPYRHGGTTPYGFDCSGFTQFVFAQLGINLPRTSSSQRNVGTVVSREDAQPGDLVWWPGHVGIFAEGNTFIDSAGPGRTVQFRNMWHRNPTFIRL